MLNRTTPRRLTFIVIALILGILLGLAFFPSEDLAGLESAGICDTVSEIPTAECAALEALYTATGGSGWTNHTGWLENATPCTWYGVTCAGGHVWHLELSSNQLSGPLPPAIGDLSQLQVLLLNQNGLTGSLPAQLGQLSNLTRLNLANNQLSGSIPADLTNLAKLRDLSFAFNDLSGEIPAQINEMVSLETVELLSNTLEGPIPAGLGSVPNLGWLDVADNMLTGTIPIELALAGELTTLYARGNQLEGEVPAGLCDNITLATLGYNKFDPAHTNPCIQEAIVDNWQATQTLPPVDLVADLTVPGEVHLTWTAVDELVDIGYYEILYAHTSGGPYTRHGQTTDKHTTSYIISDLDLTQDLFITVRTVTPPNGNNQNTLISADSSEASTVPNAITLASFQVNAPLPSWWLLLFIALILFTLGLLFTPRLAPRLLKSK